ncbi:histamine N-methyltransferase-like [Acropora millepora]|uniref:histamine N-methyltransferase-like n=1 Tax=Acropora millepora TaxID=45264 RepID=UPI001CF266B5|nr:histamine N-methyltransferase-like [Acropora millepora]
MLSSFACTSEHYYKSFDAFKNKTSEFFKNVEIMRDHMPSMIQKLLHSVQDHTSFNILSVGSGTGDMDLEILKIVKDELQRSQGCQQMKIFSRAIEINKYPCDLYKAAIKNLNDQQTDFDLRHQSFEEYADEFTMEQPKFDVIHFIHSIYFLDIEAVLKHCIENELQDNGRLVFIVQRPDLMSSVLEKQGFLDWHGTSDEKNPESLETAEKMFEITEKYGWKHEVYTHEYSIDVTEIFDAQSTEGNLLLDFITHTANYRGTADKKLLQETLAVIEDLSTLKDGKRLGEKKESLIFIYK